MQQLGNQRGPAGLMLGAAAAAGVAVKVFIKQDVVFEVRISLHLRVRTDNILIVRLPPPVALSKSASEVVLSVRFTAPCP